MTIPDETPEPTSRYLNRELSWLAFNSRVLAQAEDERLPLLERFKFCAIFSSNLDEFFQVRVAGLKEQVAAGVAAPPPDGLSPLAQLQAIRREVIGQGGRLEHLQRVALPPALAAEGIHLLDWHQLDKRERKIATGEFEDRIFPVLTPLAVDPSHPFPYISNLSLSLAVLVDDPDVDSLRFARLKVPPSLARFVEIGSGRFVPVEQVIVAHLDQLFPGVGVVGGWPFRVTRNADLTVDDADADDLLEAVELELRRRRFGRAIRLELDPSTPNEAHELLLRELDLDTDDVYHHGAPLDPTGYWQLLALDRPDLKVAGFAGVTPRRLRDVEDSHDFFAQLARGEVLVHHPYEAFNASVTELVRQASRDPGVLAIKITLYRTSGDSPIIDALIRAADRGKQVAVLVELKARFDEEANIGWARRLEEAGVHVVYGLVGLKIHTKIALVIRDEPDGIRRYCHVGTGNYNPKTARIYSDFGILTASAELGSDLTDLFNVLTGFASPAGYRKLIVAPRGMRERFLGMIRRELEHHQAGRPARIMAKMNALVDPEIIVALYQASQAGVPVDLIVRGICCLRPGLPGISSTIRVISIVGRFLEHSRAYYFLNGGQEEVYIGSADWMPRNLDRRIEAVAPVEDPAHRQTLRDVLLLMWQDNRQAWELDADGTYQQRHPAPDEPERATHRLLGERVVRAVEPRV
jgi:polyphosphate kinase